MLNLQLLFLAKKKTSGFKSDIALDDIVFTTGKCSTRRTIQKNGKKEYFYD